MLHYNGLVERLIGNDCATVVITPDKLGIPGAPEVSKKVCHRATAGSTIRITALNGAGAQVGDWVSVNQKPGVLVKNATNLVGLPLFGAVFGYMVAGIWMGGFLVHSAMAVVSVIIGLLLGVIFGVYRHRRASPENKPVIGKIVRSREDMATMQHNVKRPAETEQGTCCAVSH